MRIHAKRHAKPRIFDTLSHNKKRSKKVITFRLKLQKQKKPARKQAFLSLIFNGYLVELSGIEPLTSTLPVLRSPS